MGYINMNGSAASNRSRIFVVEGRHVSIISRLSYLSSWEAIELLFCRAVISCEWFDRVFLKLSRSASICLPHDRIINSKGPKDIIH